MVRNPYAIRPKQPAPRRLPTVRIAPAKAAAGTKTSPVTSLRAVRIAPTLTTCRS